MTANRVLRYVRTLQNEQAQVWARLGDSEARCATLTKEVRTCNNYKAPSMAHHGSSSRLVVLAAGGGEAACAEGGRGGHEPGGPAVHAE